MLVRFLWLALYYGFLEYFRNIFKPFFSRILLNLTWLYIQISHMFFIIFSATAHLYIISFFFHLTIFLFLYLLILHPDIFILAHLHIFTSFYLLIFIFAYLHILLSSYPYIFISSYLHILTSSQVQIVLSSLYILLFYILSSQYVLIFVVAYFKSLYSFIFFPLFSWSLALSFFSINRRCQRNAVRKAWGSIAQNFWCIFF